MCVGMFAVQPCCWSMCAWEVRLDVVQPVGWQQTEASCSVRWKKFPLVRSRSKRSTLSVGVKMEEGGSGGDGGVTAMKDSCSSSGLNLVLRRHCSSSQVCLAL